MPGMRLRRVHRNHKNQTDEYHGWSVVKAGKQHHYFGFGCSAHNSRGLYGAFSSRAARRAIHIEDVPTLCAVACPKDRKPKANDYAALLSPAAAFRASIALTEFLNAFSKTPFPMVPTTRPSNDPLRFLPSRTVTRSMSVKPSGRCVKS